MKAVLLIFSPIVHISPPLSQMCLNMERDVRKGHRTKSQGILNRLKDTLHYLCRKTLRKRKYFHTNNLQSHYIYFQCFVLWRGVLFLRHSLKSVKYQTLLIGLFLMSPRDKNLSSGAYSAQKFKNFSNI